MRQVVLITLLLLGALFPSTAGAFQIAVHDEGATPTLLQDTAEDLGTRTVRVVVTPENPQANLVRAYRSAGLEVMVAIQLKKHHTAGNVRAVVNALPGVQTVSIGNEPEVNGFTQCQYVNLYRRAYRVLKREHPRLRVGFGEYSPFAVTTHISEATECMGGRDGRSGQASGRELARVERPGQAGRTGRGRGGAATGSHPVVRPGARAVSAQGANSRTGSRVGEPPIQRPLRADFLAVHPYQFNTDPLAPYHKTGGRWRGAWHGIGDLRRIHRHLRTRAVRGRLQTPQGKPLPIRVTEFAYLTSGRYAIPEQRAAQWWPRAIRQARRWSEQLVIYGLGPVHETSNWGSATLLDRFGQPTDSFDAIAKALGLRAPRRASPPPAPAGDLITPGPDLDHVPLEPAPPVVGGASDEKPTEVVIPEPMPTKPLDELASPPGVPTTPETLEATEGAGE